ncbi:MAG: hypothetical protein F4Y00_07665 [Bacteroidetes bacterium SB0662_bin_6]|nr:hypothetical protein [Bacteroidetes bacterium SB0662_bin_6]
MIASNASFVVELDDDGDARAVRGFVVRGNVAETIRRGEVGADARSLLRAYGWMSADTIWRDVALAKTLVCVFFVLPFAFGAASLSCYALNGESGDGFRGGAAAQITGHGKEE